MWKQIKAGGLGAALSPSPPMGTERSPGGGPGGTRKLASFQHFRHLILSIQKKEFHQNNPIFLSLKVLLHRHHKINDKEEKVVPDL